MTQHYDIVEACKRGDRKAQFELYKLYSKAMYNICMRMLNSAENAEDALKTPSWMCFQSWIRSGLSPR